MSHSNTDFVHPEDPEVLEELSDQKWRSTDIDGALALRRRALLLHVLRDDQAARARCLQSIGYLCLLMQNYSAAEDAYREAIEVMEHLGNRRGAAAAWGRLGEVLQQAGEHARAVGALERCMALVRSHGGAKELGISLNNVGVSLRELGDRSQAMQCHQRALEIRRSLGDHEGLAATLHNMGVLHSDNGDHPSAVAFLQAARTLRMEIVDIGGLACTELYLGLLLEQQAEHSRAEQKYHRAIELCGNDPAFARTRSAALSNLGGLLVASGEAARALPHLLHALALFREAPSAPEAAAVNFNIGIAHIALGQFNEGLEALSCAQRIQELRGDRGNLSATLCARGMGEAARGDLLQAEALLLKAVDLQCRLAEWEAASHTSTLLAQCKGRQGDPAAAAMYKELSASLAAMQLRNASCAGAFSAITSLAATADGPIDGPVDGRQLLQ